MSKIRPLRWWLLFGLWLAFPQGTFGQAALPVPRGNILGIVFVANGAGNSRSVTENLWDALGRSGVVVSIQTIDWCQTGKVARDHKDWKAQLRAGAEMARQAAAYRAAYPERKIYLMGHSSGTHVVLAAANLLPPGTVDRIVLLAPSVSYCYDLRRALQGAQEGIDCYFSPDDMEVALGVEWFDTADRLPVPAAGEYGFGYLLPTHPDAYLYAKLHQFCWNPTAAWTGHRGGHYGATESCFLRAYVIPTMLSGLSTGSGTPTVKTSPSPSEHGNDKGSGGAAR